MEYAMAARWWGWSRLEDFRRLGTEEQAELIAVYRVQNQIAGVHDYQEHLAAKRGARRKA
jgi:hypothetical protein